MKQFTDSEYAQYADFENAAIVLLPIPYDGTSTWIKGADRGPEQLLEAASNLEFYDIETDSEVIKRGIHTLRPVKEKSSPEAMSATVRRIVGEMIEKQKFVVSLGGEHSVSIGAIQAHAAHYSNLCILQIDAHADLRRTYEGSAYNHACVMARAREVAPIIQVGIRSMSAPEKEDMNPENVIFAHQIHDGTDWLQRVEKRLLPNTYITIDLDGFDPSVIPGTGTPEPGGLFWHQAMQLLRLVAKSSTIVGFDIVELCPQPHSKISEFAAARLLYQLLSYRFANQS